ncbi:hypothetical protein, partial [Rudaea sp.]|uniref:hypothetical protein n=1 Tax=Rudaea sp. TaxID=2136325 RepID=UPI002ED3F3E2
ILLNAHALRCADRIGLDAGERLFTRMRRRDWCGQLATCLISIALACWLPMHSVLAFSAPGFAYMLTGVCGALSGRRYRRQLARLQPSGA